MHPTKNIIIEKADVDEEMVELIKLLNKFPCIRTSYCCQGDEYDDGTIHQCYVVFDCTSSYRLTQLARLICKPDLGNIQIFWQSDALEGRIQWSLDIHTSKKRDKIITALKIWIKHNEMYKK